MPSRTARALIALAAATTLVLGAAGAATADSLDSESFAPGPMCCSG